MEIITSTNIAARFVICMKCDKVWRTTDETCCLCCVDSNCISFQLDPLRATYLMDAMKEFENEENEDEDDVMRLAIAMEDHCSWYNEGDPWCSQTCWMYLRNCPPVLHIKRAMEIFEASFQERVVLVDENGNIS
jgi:hypothetical protein